MTTTPQTSTSTSTTQQPALYLLVPIAHYDGYDGPCEHYDYERALEAGYFTTRQAAENAERAHLTQQRTDHERYIAEARARHEEKVSAYREQQNARTLLEKSGASTAGIRWAPDPGQFTPTPFETWRTESYHIEEISAHA